MDVLQGYTASDYKADIQALQTATSSWYLSIQGTHADRDARGAATPPSEQGTPASSACTTPKGAGKVCFSAAMLASHCHMPGVLCAAGHPVPLTPTGSFYPTSKK